MSEPIRPREKILRDIRSASGKEQSQALEADVLMRILEVLLDIREKLEREQTEP
jgi:hypothetical protein